MRIYWTINSAPELRNLPVQERKRILRSLQGKLLRRWQFWVIAAGFGVVVPFFLNRVPEVSFYIRVPIIFFVMFVLLFGVVRPMQAHLMRPLVREHLERERQ